MSIPISSLPEPALDDQRSLITRIHSICSAADESSRKPLKRKVLEIPAELLRNLSKVSKQSSILCKDGIPFGLQNFSTPVYGAAADIGTTTIVIYLLNLLTGEQIDTFSALNAQKKFGADVISRITFASKSEENRKKISETIAFQLEEGIQQLLRKHTINEDHFHLLCAAGNTTMMHLLAGVHTEGIAVSPFIPVFTDMMVFAAAELGMTRIKKASIELMPSVAAYIGSDITAGIHVSGIHESEEPEILLDIGTNGEIALESAGTILCCSTAAGPAFEGANITCGTGGIPGAVDSVALNPDGVSFTTIGGAKPVGICGSGIIDAAAELLEYGIIDYTGRLLGPEETDHPCIQERNGEPIFLLSSSGE
nr:ASKHA domain-containing protein [Spirochaetales bacterium]